MSATGTSKKSERLYGIAEYRASFKAAQAELAVTLAENAAAATVQRAVRCT